MALEAQFLEDFRARNNSICFPAITRPIEKRLIVFLL